MIERGEIVLTPTAPTTDIKRAAIAVVVRPRLRVEDSFRSERAFDTVKLN